MKRDRDERPEIEMKREERRYDFLEKRLKSKSPPDDLSHKDSRTIACGRIIRSKVQISIFSIIYMIRIPSFGPWELIQNEFSGRTVFKSVRFMSEVFAHQTSRRGDSDQERYARKVAWDLSKKHKLKNSDRTTFCTLC